MKYKYLFVIDWLMVISFLKFVEIEMVKCIRYYYLLVIKEETKSNTESVLSMEIASTGPQSLRSEYNTDTEIAETSWVTGTENLQTEVRLLSLSEFWTGGTQH